MAKKHRKKKRQFVPDSEAKSAIKQRLGEINWRLLGKVFLIFVIVFAVYQTGLKLGEIYRSILIQQITIWVYTIITTVLAAAFILINGGLSKDIPTKEQLKDSLSDKEKQDIIDEVIRRRKKAKKILIYLIPFVFTLFFDTIYLLLFVK